MKISFAICTHNEKHYIERLLYKLIDFVSAESPTSDTEYEIIVVDDYSDVDTVNILEKYSSNITVVKHALNKHYANHKNFMNSYCTGDWIFNLDADEFVSEDFLIFIPQLIDMNPDIDAFWIPRVNTVDGLTIRHLQKWGWTLSKFEDYRRIKILNRTSDEYVLLKGFDFIISEELSGIDDDIIVTYYEPIIAWPDFQMRLYKNSPKIHWVNAVHEKLIGFNKCGMLPQDEQLAIQHFKDIDRQEQQNSFYETLSR